jgi:hypothetical protein
MALRGAYRNDAMQTVERNSDENKSDKGERQKTTKKRESETATEKSKWDKND